ncbi:MAG: FAD-dependent monooxygenase [Candidatus Kapaibacterium sp.]|nr:MAG: FAD-dependent monooxygenase [Candidatus Kapabacteria bacterium]
MNPNESQQSSAPKRVSIIGAGLVGSLLAIFLAKRGISVDVFDRRADIRHTEAERGRSINLALSLRGLRALEAAGIGSGNASSNETMSNDAMSNDAAAQKFDIAQIGLPMYGRMIHTASGDAVFQPYGKDGEAIYSVSRTNLNKLLLDAAETEQNIKLHFSARCLEVAPEQATAEFVDVNGKHFSHSSDCLIGADGAYSPVRSAMQKRERFNYEQFYLDHAYKELSIPANPDGSWKMSNNALHIWPRARFMLIALPNRDGSFTCTLFLPFEAAFEGETSFHALRTAEDVQDCFQKLFPDALALMPTLTEDFFHNPTSSLVTIRCAPWTIQDKAMLIGDAAHAIVPFYGQGMNAGFEDCRVFDELLSKHENRWAEAMNEYQLARKPNADAIARLAMENFIEMSERVADPKFLLRKKIEQDLHLRYGEAFLPVYSMVTFSHIPYVNALREMEHQNALFAAIMRFPDIEHSWNTPAMQEKIRFTMQEFGYAV